MPRVLVVEDSPTQAAEIGFLLEEAGFETVHVADGLAALSAIRRGRPDLIVTDLQMPRMDGLELVEAVRADHPAIPVVLVTAHGSEDVAARALRRGAASYVPKRDLARDLAKVVAQIIALSAPDPERMRILERLDDARLRFTLENDASLVAPLVCHLEDVVFQMDLCDRTDLTRVAVALREALVNAIDHGNLELDSDLRQDDERVYRRLGDERRAQAPYRDRRVHLDVLVSRDAATFTIRDEGPGFDPSTLPDPEDPANLERVGGRGLLLIRTLMDDVTFNDAGNAITLVKRRRQPEPQQQAVARMACC